MELMKLLRTGAALMLIALACMACSEKSQNPPQETADTSFEAAAGGNLECYSDKKGNNRIWTGNSAHNCCANKGGKSWRCNGGALVKCSVNNSYHCP